MLLKRSLLFILSCVSFNVFAQITDDTSSLVYGPATVELTYLDDVKNNTERWYEIDTLLTGFENFTEYEERNRLFQDLGNNGTAMSPIFPGLPDMIGRTSGYVGYDLYFKKPEEFKYFNTKSPFMDVMAVFGGQGRTEVDFSYSQNVNPSWNVGADLHRITSDKQIGAEQNEGDVNARSTVYDVYTYYKSKKKPYQLIFNFAALSHQVDETGGVLVTSENPLNFEFFQYRDSQIRLENAVSEVNYSQFNLYHDYGIFRQFQVYHQFDRLNKSLRYEDFVDVGTISGFDTYRDFYDEFLIDSDSTFESTEYRTMSNELGIKGDIADVFYRFYVRRREVDLAYRFLDIRPESENYLGGFARWDWQKISIEGNAETLTTGEFRVGAKLTHPLFEANYKTVRYKPSFLMDRYFGNHHEWQNDFNPAFGNEISGRLMLKWKNLTFHPTTILTNFNDFFYFNEDQTATQSTGSALMVRSGGRLNYFLPTSKDKVAGFHFNNEAYYTIVSGGASDEIQVPTLFYNGRVFWKGIIFQRSVPFEAGLSLHGKTAYFANDYNPVIQRFHLQRDFEIDGFLAADLFVNMRIDKVFVFVKFTHANQPNNDGYFIAPLYPGQSRVIDLGVRWIFFD